MKDYRKRDVGGTASVNRGGRRPLAVSGNRAKQIKMKEMKQRSVDRKLRKEAGSMAKSDNMQGARAMCKPIDSKARSAKTSTTKRTPTRKNVNTAKTAYANAQGGKYGRGYAKGGMAKGKKKGC